jgi:hypothetical protein
MKINAKSPKKDAVDRLVTNDGNSSPEAAQVGRFAPFFFVFLIFFVIFVFRKRPTKAQQIDLVSEDEQSHDHEKDNHPRKKATLERADELTATPSKTRKLPPSVMITSPSPSKKRVCSPQFESVRFFFFPYLIRKLKAMN